MVMKFLFLNLRRIKSSKSQLERHALAGQWPLILQQLLCRRFLVDTPHSRNTSKRRSKAHFFCGSSRVLTIAES